MCKLDCSLDSFRCASGVLNIIIKSDYCWMRFGRTRAKGDLHIVLCWCVVSMFAATAAAVHDCSGNVFGIRFY